MTVKPTRLASVAIAALGLLLATPTRPFAHDIPARVTVLAFVKPEPGRLRLLVRVPLEAMRDLTLPAGPGGALDIAKAELLMPEAAKQWIAQEVELRENDTPLPFGRVVATRISLPSDRSFTDYDSALAHVSGPVLSNVADLQWKQAMLDVLIEYPITSEHSRFSIKPALARLGVRTITVLRFLPAGGAERAFEYVGDPGLVQLDPRWHQAALRFVRLGFTHILDGIDHLLFVFCLVIPFRRFRPLLAIVTAFTVAHSITLIAAASGLVPDALWFPPLIEMLIALSIVYMALENIVGARLDRRWAVAFGFGLVHGFGFSFALGESLQFAGRHLVTSLLAFNVGVEIGQVVVLLVAIPALALLFKRIEVERVGTIILSALVAHTAWHWMTERWGALVQYRFEWPGTDPVSIAGMMRGAMLLLFALGAAWAIRSLLARRIPALRRDPRTDEPS